MVHSTRVGGVLPAGAQSLAIEVQAAGASLRRWSQVVRVCLVGCMSAKGRPGLFSVIMIAGLITEDRPGQDRCDVP